MTASGEHLAFAALTAIHYSHRAMAGAVFAAIALLAWRLHRAGALGRQVRWLIAIAALQFATGLSNVVLDWPLVAAVLHTGGAAALVAVLTWSACETRAWTIAIHSAREVSA